MALRLDFLPISYPAVSSEASLQTTKLDHRQRIALECDASPVICVSGGELPFGIGKKVRPDGVDV